MIQKKYFMIKKKCKSRKNHRSLRSRVGFFFGKELSNPDKKQRCFAFSHPKLNIPKKLRTTTAIRLLRLTMF